MLECMVWYQIHDLSGIEVFTNCLLRLIYLAVILKFNEEKCFAMALFQVFPVYFRLDIAYTMLFQI